MSSEKETLYVLQAASTIDPTMEAILKSRDVDFDDVTYAPFDSLLEEAVVTFLRLYQGGNGFLNSLKRQISHLSPKQRRAAANILRRSLRSEEQLVGHGFNRTLPPPTTGPFTTLPSPGTPGTGPNNGPAFQQALAHPPAGTALDDLPPGTYGNKCYTCHKYVVGTMQDLMDHKRDAHGAASGSYTPSTSYHGLTPRNVKPIERTTPKHNLDIRTLLPANARFAVEQPDGTHNFFIKTTLKRRQKLNGRFQWTKYPQRWAILNPGDITMRKQSGDTKEFIGDQEVGDDFYYGEYEDDIKVVCEDPDKAMMTYGRIMKHCAYCGKSLTDKDSQELGIGPDCLVNYHIPRLQAKGAAALAAIKRGGA